MNVYIVSMGNNKPFKIGKANNVDQRILELQTGNPEKLKLVISVPFKSEKQAFDFEKKLQRFIKKYHIRGEWYRHHGMKVLNKLFLESSPDVLYPGKIPNIEYVTDNIDYENMAHWNNL